jgi:hypothetical protein
MNATTKTLTFAAVAVVAVTIALITRTVNQPNTVDGFAEVGQPFFPEFDDPTRATALKVAVFDEDAQEASAFSVRQNDDGLWVIPSHHDYPAEAADRLARTATSFIGVTKSAVASRSKDDWAEYGVCDPGSGSVPEGTQCGTRVTLSDASGNPLVDLIVGNAVPDRENTFYVREPEKNTTYLAELDVELTAKFSDWIEPDLLKVTQTDIVRLVKDNYYIDEDQGVVKQGETLTFEKEDLKTAGTWTLTDLDVATEEVVSSPISALARNVDQLEIVGVRPKPEGINADLTVSPEVANNPLMLQVLQADMQKQGFYVAPGTDQKIRLFSNEGELIAGTDKGVEYTLYFGEIARGTGRDLEVGFAEDTSEDAGADGDGEPAADGEEDSEDPASDESEDGPRRYLLVKVEFDESLLGPKPTAPVEPVKPAILDEPAEQPEEAAKAGDAAGSDAAEKPADKDAAASGDEKGNPPEQPEASKTPADNGDQDDACFIDEPVETQQEKPSTTETKQEESSASTGQSEAGSDETPAATDEPKQESPPASTEKTDAAGKDSAEATAATQEDKTADENAPAAADETGEEQEKVDPRVAAQQAYDAAMGEYEAAKRAYETDLKAWEDRAADGREKAEELATRFAGWYYVITAESFEKFKVTRVDVTKKKEDAADAGTDTTPPFSLPNQ